MRDHRYDLLVVGGGIGGAYVAYRSAQRHPDWRIALFERSQRIGGRLLSLRLPGVTDVAAEMGGMRFRTSQPLITKLVDDLGLATRPFVTVHDDNRYFLRQSRWRFSDPQDAVPAYDLGEGEAGLSPAEVLLSAFEEIVPGATAMTDQDWLAVKREFAFRDRPLIDWSLGEALAAVLTAEGMRYVVDGFGYATLLTERNAADAIPWILIETRPESENTTLVEGMERLPRAASEVFEATGGTIELGREVCAIEEDDGGFTVRCTDGADAWARRVVLALTRRSLQRIAGESSRLLGREVNDLLATVTPYGAAKLALSFERAWWREDGFNGLRSVSDLALSKTYYFDRALGWDGSPLMLASYSDGPSRDHWASLADRDRQPDDPEPFESQERWRRYEAAPAQVAGLTEQLGTLHQRPVPEPLGSAFMDWSVGATDGAWHLWNPGERSWEVMARIAEPLPRRPLFICGEAYSWSQGWVEGALETAQRAVDHLQ